MNKYLVKVFDVFATFVEVEAESHDEARAKVKERVEAGEVREESFYETTLEPDLWMVMSMDEIEAQQENFKQKFKEYKERREKESESAK